jgi:hypothetical protein
MCYAKKTYRTVEAYLHALITLVLYSYVGEWQSSYTSHFPTRKEPLVPNG